MTSLSFSPRLEEEGARRTEAQRALREAMSQVSELKEEVENERGMRERAEKQRRDLGEELEALRTELEDTLDTTAAQQELRSRREAELGELQRCVEGETRRHEAQLSELRVKHCSAIDNLQEQLDNSKRVSHTQNVAYVVTLCILRVLFPQYNVGSDSCMLFSLCRLVTETSVM